MSVRGKLVESRGGGWVPYYEPGRDPVNALVGEHALAFELIEVVAWGMTIIFALADLWTTAIGLPHPMLAEAVPSTLWIVEQYGWPGLAVEHALTLGFLATLWQFLPQPYRVIVPLEGAFAGYLITHNNLVALLAHGVSLSI